MELFSIERYEGDLYSAENNTEKESKNLAKLLRQARGRGRKRSREGSNSKQKDENKGDNESGIVLEAFPKINQNAKKKDFKEKRNKLEGEVIKETKKDKHIDKSKSVGSEHDDDDAAQMLITGEQRTSTNGAANNISKANSVTLKMKNEDENEKHLENTKQKELSSTMSKQTRNKEILKPQLEMTVIGGDSKTQKPKGVQRTLPKWLANPSFFCSDVNKNLLAITEIEGLHSGLVQKLEKQGVKHFFPVQESVIPAVLSSWEKNSSFGKGGFPPQDICVCAPTGSGKTLAYVLPVIEVLKQNTVRRIEALVIVPTKDLATQVWHVFNIYVQGTGLSVGLANGLRSLQKEQQQLGSNSFLGYSSNVNILVATPGRLVEHISSTDGFSLQFLRFLIIDEADRLLAEPYFGWLDKVYESVFSSIQSQETHRSPLNTLTPLKTEKIQRPLQKLLFSATLTQNPEKLALLQLYKPRFFTVSKSKNDTRGTKELNNGANEEFDMLLETPATLEESMYICNSGGKPLVLLHLLTAQSLDGVLCFTSSVESTHRLHLVVKHFGGIGVQEFSSNLTAARRQAILNNFKCGKTQIIICSDAMARGLDVPAVKYVISYDPPVSSKTYVHRVGRTARAGKTGSAITLLHDNEVFHFKKMLKSLKKDRISKHSIKDGDLECLMEKYKNALEQLKTEMASSKKQIKRMRR